MDKIKVLVVDDHPMVLEGMRSMLVQIGFVTVSGTVSNAYAAMEHIKITPPDIVITDINMPEMNGMEMVQELKKAEKYRQIPIFFITAQENEALRKEGIALGVQGFIPKPFQPEVILDLLQKAMEKTGNE